MTPEDMKSWAFADARQLGCPDLCKDCFEAGMGAQQVHQLFRKSLQQFKSKDETRKYIGGALKRWKIDCGLTPKEDKPAKPYAPTTTVVGRPRGEPEFGTPEWAEWDRRIRERAKRPPRRTGLIKRKA